MVQRRRFLWTWVDYQGRFSTKELAMSHVVKLMLGDQVVWP